MFLLQLLHQTIITVSCIQLTNWCNLHHVIHCKKFDFLILSLHTVKHEPYQEKGRVWPSILAMYIFLQCNYFSSWSFKCISVQNKRKTILLNKARKQCYITNKSKIRFMFKKTQFYSIFIFRLSAYVSVISCSCSYLKR